MTSSAKKKNRSSVPEMIFLTTSNGVYLIDTEKYVSRKILGKNETVGYFGIDSHAATGDLIVAGRSNLGTETHGKHSADVTLYRIDPQTLKSDKVMAVYDVHDVHQIAVFQDLIFLTDTGKNRIAVADLNARSFLKWIEITESRDDVNHVNALHADEERLIIGMNNRGFIYSGLLELNMRDVLTGGESRRIGHTRFELIPGLFHSHDAEPFGDDFLICAAHKGAIFSVQKRNPLFHVDGWCRGIALSEAGIWVGSSPLSERINRHSDKLSGSAELYDRDKFRHKRSVRLDGSGQVNDLIAVSGLRESETGK